MVTSPFYPFLTNRFFALQGAWCSLDPCERRRSRRSGRTLGFHDIKIPASQVSPFTIAETRAGRHEKMSSLPGLFLVFCMQHWLSSFVLGQWHRSCAAAMRSSLFVSWMRCKFSHMSTLPSINRKPHSYIWQLIYLKINYRKQPQSNLIFDPVEGLVFFESGAQGYDKQITEKCIKKIFVTQPEVIRYNCDRKNWTHAARRNHSTWACHSNLCRDVAKQSASASCRKMLCRGR